MFKGLTKSLVAAAALAGATVLGAAPSFAQEPAASLGELIRRLQQDSRETSAEAREREAEFRARAAEQERLLNEALAELTALQEEGETLAAEFDANDARILELEEQLRDAQGEFGELFGVARQAASDVGALIDASLVSAEFPGRSDGLNAIAETSSLPTRRELDAIWTTLLHEMVHQREVARFTARVSNYGSNNTTVDAEVVRIGVFTIFGDDRGAPRFLEYDPAGAPALNTLARAPASATVNAARAVINAGPDDLVAGPVDPSRGVLLGLVVDTPSTRERVDQGGLVGYITLTIAAVGVVFGLFRLVQLTLVNMSVRGQARRLSSPSRSNPLGRILLAAEDARSSEIETFELKLDQAIIRESSGLDFGLNFLKLAAGIAPLLGLLGTVVGMIVTFQQITLFGTGDPKIMAGGISQALVTTVLGLVSAIPLLLIHSFCASASRGVQTILEEQSAGIVAEHAAARTR